MLEKKIIAYCNRSSQVAYFAELSGGFQYTVSLFCRTIFEVTAFFTSLGDLLPLASFELSFAIRVQWTQFHGKLFQDDPQPTIVDRGRIPAETTIDELDRKILAAYSKQAASPLSQIATLVGSSESTVRNRLESLEKRRVILSMPYFFDSTKSGLSTFRIIFYAKKFDTALHTKMYQYAINHPRASAFVHCVGSWDFELSFDIEDPVETAEILDNFHDTFGSYIRKTQTITELTVHRAHHFPADAGREVLPA